MLATTDIATHALDALRESSIRKVYLVGRRGPVQAACTAKELREILAIKDLHINIKEADLLNTSADEGDILEDLANEPKKDMYMMSVDPEDAPNKPEYLEIGIVSGIPVSINGKELSPASHREPIM